MSFKFKKYIYLLNDVTNLILNKDQEIEKLEIEDKVNKMRIAIILLSALLMISVFVNIFLLVK